MLATILWKFKGEIAIALLILSVVGTFMWQTHKIDSLTDERNALRGENEKFDKSLTALKESTQRQIKALESQNAENKARAEAKSKLVKEVENNNEAVECPLPDFVRSAFERM